jgi:hypothetical protein
MVMYTNIGILMAALLVANARGGCGPDNTGADTGTSVGVTAGKAAGTATDPQGQPLAGAEITVCNPVFLYSCVNAKTGPDGRYSIDLQPVNVWNASGSINKTFNGKSYCLDLSPSSTATFSSADGAIRDFQWKLTGLRPDMTATDESLSFYGAALSVVDGSANFAVDPRYVEVTFTPEGPLVDGSAGQTFSATAGAWKWNKIGNIPLGRYTITASYAAPGAAKSPLLVTPSASGQYASSTILDFDPVGTCGHPEAAIFVLLAQ